MVLFTEKALKWSWIKGEKKGLPYFKAEFKPAIFQSRTSGITSKSLLSVIKKQFCGAFQLQSPKPVFHFLCFMNKPDQYSERKPAVSGHFRTLVSCINWKTPPKSGQWGRMGAKYLERTDGLSHPSWWSVGADLGFSLCEISLWFGAVKWLD